MTTVRSKSDGQFARVATNLGIGIAGLVIIRLIVQGLPMFKDAGWIVPEKLTVLAAAVIAVDAMLLSVLIGFAIELRAFLFRHFAEIPAWEPWRPILSFSSPPESRRPISSR